MEFKNLLLDLTPKLGGKLDYTIGLIGTGGIARSAHLPAYRDAGFRVIAAVDPVMEARNLARNEFGIERTYETAEEMIAKEKPDIVDITVSWLKPELKLELTRMAAEAGCHILIQKPLAGTYDEAMKIVECAEAHNVKLAVNQQGRWGPAFYAAKRLAKILDIGAFRTVNFGIRTTFPLPYAIHDVSIHSCDLMRFWFEEEPESIFAVKSVRDGSPKFVSANLEFSGDRLASIGDYFNYPGVVDWNFRIGGDRGAITGSDYYIFSERRAWVEGWSDSTGGTHVHVEPLDGDYIPLAFRFPMAELMNAIDEDRDPFTNGRDNLNSLAIVLAVQKSVNTGQPVAPSEIKNV